MLSKDGIAFIHHDKELHRCSNGTGYFASKTAQELQTLDAGKWFSPEFEGERIPLLEDLIKACKDDNLGLNIEVKHLRVNADDIPTEEETVAERAVATETCRIIQSLEDKDRICFSSFSVAALEICQVMCPSIPRSLLVEAIPSNWQSEVTRLGAVSLNFNHKKCTQQQVEEIQKTGTPMYCYTVNEGPRAVELLQWGVSGVFSDCPDVIEASILASNLPPVPPCA